MRFVHNAMAGESDVLASELIKYIGPHGKMALLSVCEAARHLRWLDARIVDGEVVGGVRVGYSACFRRASYAGLN